MVLVFYRDNLFQIVASKSAIYSCVREQDMRCHFKFTKTDQQLELLNIPSNEQKYRTLANVMLVCYCLCKNVRQEE